MIFTPLYKLIFTYTISLFLAALFGGGFWWLLFQVNSAAGVLQETETKIAALVEERKVARETKILLEGRDADFRRIQKFLLGREKPIDFIEALEGLAKDTGNLLAIDFDESRSKSEGFLFFRLTTEGTERSVRRYLALIELLPYEIRVEDLALQQFLSGEGETQFVLPKKVGGRQVSHRLIFTIQVKTL